MKNQLTIAARRTMLATTLVLSAVAAHAAGGYTVTKDQEAQVSVGMTAAEVQQALGTPDAKATFANEEGPTFSYRVIGSEQMIFDVDFNAEGRVASVDERVAHVGSET